MEQNTYRIPAHYICALVNGDYTALSDNEENELVSWLDKVQPGHATPPDGAPFFCAHNDVQGFIGNDCYDVVFNPA